MNASIQWAAKVAHVREVSLLGTADFAFWKERLAVDDLLPAEVDGRAQLIVISADLKYMGVRFRELSFSVAVSRPRDNFGPDAAYLLRAFNTSRTFACMERAFFSTPYFHGDVRLSTALPASIQLVEQGELLFAAEMGNDASAGERQPANSGDDRWEGPVFLPRAQRQAHRQGKLFVARVNGETRKYPFLPHCDSLTIRPSPASEVLPLLIDSQFAVREWIVREDANHAKSKTYRRDILLP